MKIENCPITFSSTSLGADITSHAMSLQHIAMYCIQIVMSGTPTGTFKLQLSLDEGAPSANTYDAKVAGVTNWTDVGDSQQNVTDAGSVTWNVADSAYNWVRVVYLRDSSTGTITSARANLKGV